MTGSLTSRARGQIFVCANACCCGRTDLTNAPVPTERYHEEWSRRRLRNFVHLTVGGCLGPCALANVAMLLFDGQSFWFHSMNDDAAVGALFDHIEQLLEGPPTSPPTVALSQKMFTAYQWQPRPDGAELDDQRAWRGREHRPDQPPACELDPATLQVMAVEARVAEIREMTATLAIPRKDGEPVFAAPWQGRAFGLAVATAQGPQWDAFRERLIAEIAASEALAEPSDYYGDWLRAFESYLEASGLVTTAELAERTAEFEFGERQEVF